MGRVHVITNAKTGKVEVVAFSAQEEAEADAAVSPVADAKRDPLTEIEELKAALIEKGIIAASDIASESKAMTDG